jgi:hypothetical protein
MAFFDNKKVNTSTTLVDNYNLGFSEVTGSAAAALGDNNVVITSDQGAIKGALSLAGDVVDQSSANLRTLSDANVSSLRNLTDSNVSSLRNLTDATLSSLRTVTDANSSSYRDNLGLLSDVLDYTANAGRSQIELYKGYAEQLGSFAKSQSDNQGDQMAAAMKWMIGGLVLLGAVSFMTRGHA